MGVIAIPEPDLGILDRREEIVRDLQKLVQADGLISDPTELVPYETDAFTAYRRVPLAVVLPESTEQVSAVLKYCHEAGVPVIPRGAGTSLAGGAIPQEDAVVIG
ncbi:MAG: FAD-binding oxidoreductase, partial [Hyphomicrobiales bacterium]